MVNEGYKYDVAISYAGEDRDCAEALADLLQNRGVKVFYDKYERAILWGEDLYTYLSDLYQNKARYCILFLSQHYVKKLWTKHELKSAQARALKEQDVYILPIRLDDSEVPGILPTIAYLDWHQETPETIANLIIDKLKRTAEEASNFARKLDQDKIIQFINLTTSQGVLILGNFAKERKSILDTLKNELRKYGLEPLFFDIFKPINRDYTETLRTLAGMSHFILADLTNSRSIPQELQTIIPYYSSIPIQPLIYKTEEPYAIFEDLIKGYPWTLKPFIYKDASELQAHLPIIITNLEKYLQESKAKENH